jgi:transcription-repair coupling factor (superfamily II helicase)
MNKKWKWIILYAGVLITISLLGVTLQSSKKGEEEGGKIERTMDVMSSAVVKAGNMFNTSSLLPTLVQIVQDSQRLYQRRKERENNRRQKKENREEEQQSVGALKEGQAEVHENYGEEEEEGGGKWPSQRGRSNQTAV